MSTTEIPFELLPWQRSKLLEFVHQFDSTYGDSSFDPQHEISDPMIIALALRVAGLMNFQGEALRKLFVDQFALINVNEGALETVLSMARLIDAQRRVRVACGGRN